MNETTNVTSYCLEHYDEVKDLKHCNTIYNKTHHRKTVRFVKACQLFNIIINNVGTLIQNMPLTEEVMIPKFYDRVDEYKEAGN